MRQIQKTIEGLQVLAIYDEDGYSVCLEHDLIWAGPGNEEELARVSAEHRERLDELGWSVDTDVQRWRFLV